MIPVATPPKIRAVIPKIVPSLRPFAAISALVTEDTTTNLVLGILVRRKCRP